MAVLLQSTEISYLIHPFELNLVVQSAQEHFYNEPKDQRSGIWLNP